MLGQLMLKQILMVLLKLNLKQQLIV